MARNPLRSWLRGKLLDGFWYPLFRSGVAKTYATISLGYRFKESFSLYGHVPAGAAELYQLILLVIGLAWLGFVMNPLSQVLSLPITQSMGAALALYPPTELLLFSLDWVFSAPRALRSYRRSLATFLLALVEVATYFTIAYTLAGCHLPFANAVANMTGSLFSLMRLQVFEAGGNSICSIMSHYQFVVGVWIIGIVVASLVGAVVRGERES